MDRLMRLALPSLALAMLAISPACFATCWESGSGPTAVYRNPSVPAEFKDAVFVITGQVLSERNISTPDDPEGIEWTVYTVKVLETFKGNPQRTIRLVAENSSAKFYMDTGQNYLLFVSQFPTAAMVGQERLPVDYVDNCGNSALVQDAEPAIKTVSGLSTVQ